jgi:type II secretion system protein I
MRRGGFTLLEMLVATLIMGIAVVGLLSNISTSLQHASRLADYDRAALVARRKMNELLLDSRLPKGILVSGQFDPAATGVAGGWRAQMTSFE